MLYPELLGTYGDAGNALVLAERARRREIEARVTVVGMDDEVPDASIYLLGGGEDGPQRLACDLLARSDFVERVRTGASVLAVCAGLQILGRTFCVEGNDEYEGLGLVDLVTRRGARRSVGEVVVDVGGRPLVGFENHGGHSVLGEGVPALGTMVRGQGNDGRVDGFRLSTLWGTYAHGPVLAMNPWLADEILASLAGTDLEPMASVADRLYAERVATLSSRSSE